MTSTISPVAGMLPAPATVGAAPAVAPAPAPQIASGMGLIGGPGSYGSEPLITAASGASTIAPNAGLIGAAPTTSAATNAPATQVAGVAGGGAVQAAQGAIVASPEQLVPVLQELVSVLTKLVAALQAQQGAVGGGGGAGTVGQCGMPNCTMDHAVAQGANGGVDSPAAATTHAEHGAASVAAAQPAATQRASSPAVSGTPAGTVDPSTVKDKSGTKGLQAAPLRGLEEAHRFGLPLVSGHRPGGPSSSDHTHGDAIDVGTLAIGAASSTEGTPEMKAYAEHMRLEGKAGRLGVKYVIHDGKIASSRDGWAWRDYTYPGKSAAEMEAMKSSNRGEYNRMQHYDHVHVSFN